MNRLERKQDWNPGRVHLETSPVTCAVKGSDHEPELQGQWAWTGKTDMKDICECSDWLDVGNKAESRKMLRFLVESTAFHTAREHAKGNWPGWMWK